MAAYMIAQIEVTDLDGYMKYASQTVACAEKFGGEFLVKGGACEWIEGTGADRNVIIRFESMDAAKTFYNSDEYQAILPIALANSNRTAVLVEGV
ncbi:DUF1330 domain-containing protein [Amylibacter sp. IMCC11727]|uniref:DUF1330 domain-containing protein n=1 Tax=Amylibacter sp. IMCC11727 TaxID=3039851 RepID=UPI00244DDC0D|nr:DUF1330 domain-containing protein [Amylibacter sp. IMCC11727]WGI20500.1 DUF1330 domain-containing protein [Amylibacter sp. IMCC11727]